MAGLFSALEEIFAAALEQSFGAEHRDQDPLLQASKNARFGDFQSNFAMSFGKRRQTPPREVAGQLAESLRGQRAFAEVSVAGPGFLNLRLDREWLVERLLELRQDSKLGVAWQALAGPVVVDYSSPNIAKEMHVGHLRTTNIGDCLARLLEFVGERVIRQNHLGDWGTQFGVLIEKLLEDGHREPAGLPLSDLDSLYKAAKQRAKDDEEFAERARQRVVALQSGDELSLSIWRALVARSKEHFEEIYQRLGVLLTEADVRPESSFNDALPEVVESLKELGLLHESEGAQVLYPEGFVRGKDKEPLGFIVVKRDGGYNYATTDLAAARYRVEELGASRVVYVTDARQREHFGMLFQCLKEADWCGGAVFEHAPFGMVLGEDGRPFKTSEGESPRLASLLDEAERRAALNLQEHSPHLSAERRRELARKIGMGALKYADLCTDRVKDYRFEWDRLLALEGNTAPYLLNAYVRIRSIFRKGGLEFGGFGSESVELGEPQEKALALALLEVPEAIEESARRLEPHRLCAALYQLAGGFHKFYEACPVLKAEGARRASRLALCELTGGVLELGLGLLGIEVVGEM